MNEPKPVIGLEGRADSLGYAGRTRYTHLEYEALLANASIGIAFSRDKRFFLCNRKFAELLGYRPEELVGQLGEVDRLVAGLVGLVYGHGTYSTTLRA